MDGHLHAGTESPPSRTTILGSFLRGRPRNSSQSHIQVNTDLLHRDISPSAPPQPPSPNAISARRRTIAPSVAALAVQGLNSSSSNSPSGLGITSMLRRRRSAGNVAPVPAPPPAIATSATAQAALGMGTYNNRPTSQAPPPTNGATAPTTTGATPSSSNANNHRIRLVPHLDTRRSLRFDAIGRDLKEGDPALRIGRFTDRSGLGLAAVNALGSNKLAFRSKVVSRAHAEIWVEAGGRFFVKDTKSSSGTFLNHVRLSPANTESRPYQIKDGDILQLGVDYQGGAEDIYKSVKIRIEIGREWQASANAFNTNALKNLKSLALPVAPGKQPVTTVKLPAGGKSQIPDCCICLFGVNIRQALFIAPCSHTFHYKCIRPLLESHHPAFSCPLCRTFADLEEDVEVEVEYEEEADTDEVEAGLGLGLGKDGADGIDIDIDVDVESPPHSDLGHNPGDMSVSMEDHLPGTRSNSGLGVRGNEAGAETEVEGDGSGPGLGLGIMSRMRAARRGGASRPGPGGNGNGSGSGSGGGDRASPLADLTDEPDEEMIMDVSHHVGELGMGVGGVDGDGMVDVDGTVGGKRKR
ncbi:hypothetical protein GALMADRAFT_223575 [Galerina marginata CBS 339.88]|uniref:SMAD/FHA domain-containing protein n=1 Tax=Galerina marginata (strain CBS 339.88) TaxID=685588 RepID=A0A067TK50_GALM3|nr:hypothetical protein GALMADRAFT_223575 [Galerina marginata CBS 339.88]